MTEIQWLCDILLHFKLPEAVKARFIARIGEVEERLNAPKPISVSSIPLRNIPTQQVPSTQKILDEMAVAPMGIASGIPSGPMPIPAKIDKETGRPMVSTGKGTSGPRKF